jgi:hypothetical protein
MSDKKKLRIVGDGDSMTGEEGCGEILAEMAKIEAQLVNGEVEGVLLIVRNADGEVYPVVYGMGNLAEIVGNLHLTASAITLSAFAGDDDDE